MSHPRPDTAPAGRLPATAKAARDLAGDWLAHLRRDPRGLPIPWINRWGGETVAATVVRHDPHVGRPGVFHTDHGAEPDFTRQNIGRQREAMMRGLCQVCGRPCPWSRRNLVVSGATCETVRIEELGNTACTAVSEPWLDDRCAAIATLLCPALIRRRHDEDLHVVAVRGPRDVRLLVSVGYLDPAELADADADPATEAALLAAAGGQPVAMWVKAVLLRQQVTIRDSTPAPAP